MLPVPWKLRTRADMLMAHSLDAMDGVRSAAGCGDDSFLVILLHRFMLASEKSRTQCSTRDIV